MSPHGVVEARPILPVDAMWNTEAPDEEATSKSCRAPYPWTERKALSVVVPTSISPLSRTVKRGTSLELATTNPALEIELSEPSTESTPQGVVVPMPILPVDLSIKKSTLLASDVDEAMTYWRTNGIRDAAGKIHYIDMFADIPVSNIALLTQAAWIMGSVGVGFALPDSADKQFSAGEPWDDVGDPPGDGHDVPIVGRNSAGNYIEVTWGRTHAATPPRSAATPTTSLVRRTRRSGSTPTGADRSRRAADLRGPA